jgi:hypothetical protein
MGEAVLVLPLLVATGVTIYFRRKRDDSWRATETSGDSRSDLRLVAGPWPGRVVTIAGVPKVGSAVTSWTWCLVGDGVHHGHYVVTDVDAVARRAVASWHLDTP